MVCIYRAVNGFIPWSRNRYCGTVLAGYNALDAGSIATQAVSSNYASIFIYMILYLLAGDTFHDPVLYLEDF